MTTALTTDQKIDNLRSLMVANKNKIARGISGALTAERAIQVACNSIRKNHKLLQATPQSLFGAISEAATYGWVCDGIMGQAYLVPFENRKKGITEVVLVPGYRGHLDLVRRSGQVDVTMESVHQGDEYQFNGRSVHPTHVYSADSDRRFKPVTHAYVVGFMPFGRIKAFSWTAGECIAHRNHYSQNWKRNKKPDNPWHEENPAFRVMCMKTVLLDAIHRGEFPMSVADRAVAQRDPDYQTQETMTVEQLPEAALDALEEDALQEPPKLPDAVPAEPQAGQELVDDADAENLMYAKKNIASTVQINEVEKIREYWVGQLSGNTAKDILEQLAADRIAVIRSARANHEPLDEELHDV